MQRCQKIMCRGNMQTKVTSHQPVRQHGLVLSTMNYWSQFYMISLF
jgi:hypothetical protein